MVSDCLNLIAKINEIKRSKPSNIVHKKFSLLMKKLEKKQFCYMKYEYISTYCQQGIQNFFNFT